MSYYNILHYVPAARRARRPGGLCACAVGCRGGVRVFRNMFQQNMPEGDLLVCKLSPYKASKSPSQPGGGPPPSAAGLRWIETKKRVVR